MDRLLDRRPARSERDPSQSVAGEPIRGYALRLRIMGWPRSLLALLALVAFAAPLLCGCQQVGKPRAPSTDATSAPSNETAEHEPGGSGGALVTATDDTADTDDEPDLIPSPSPSPSASDDDDHDDTPGEGPPDPPSLDRRGMPVASRYARLDRVSCEAELVRRRIAFTRVSEARGVVAPLRLAGPLSGVTFRSNLPASKSRTSPYDIYDCRLVLALDDFARILAKHDIVEVVHLSVYRPVSKKVALQGAGRRHGGALAIDAAIFKTKDGRTLSVEKDFGPRRIGVRPCPAPKGASVLRQIACEASDAQLFNVLLTPHFNRAHRNHFHLEVTAGVRWTLVR